MIKVFVERLPGVPLLPLLYPNFGREVREPLLFLNEAFRDLTEPLVEVTDDPAEAAILLLPHNFPAVRRKHAYLRRLAELSARLGKRIIVFAHGDSTAEVPLPHALVFRTSQYRSTLRENEIIMPAYAEDLLRGDTLPLRHRADLPVIGFCGWADYRDFRNHLWTVAQAMAMDLLTALTGSLHYQARKKGLGLRREAMAVLQRSPLVRTNFLIRGSYSGHRETIRVDPTQGRREYIENLRQSDLALCIRGDGNYSLRFTEALSLGRVPLLLDTETVLPLEDAIDYSAFVVRVPLSDLRHMDAAISAFWQLLTDERFGDMQRRAREAFEQFLSVKAFLRHAVSLFL